MHTPAKLKHDGPASGNSIPEGGRLAQTCQMSRADPTDPLAAALEGMPANLPLLPSRKRTAVDDRTPADIRYDEHERKRAVQSIVRGLLDHKGLVPEWTRAKVSPTAVREVAKGYSHPLCGVGPHGRLLADLMESPEPRLVPLSGEPMRCTGDAVREERLLSRWTRPPHTQKQHREAAADEQKLVDLHIRKIREAVADCAWTLGILASEADQGRPWRRHRRLLYRLALAVREELLDLYGEEQDLRAGVTP